MLKLRVIPKLQLDIRQTYKGLEPVLILTKQFSGKKGIGNPLSQAKIYEAQLVDEIVLLNLNRSEEAWPTILKTLSNMAERLATPLSVGGGVKNYEQVQELLDRGADKVIINTASYHNPELIDRVANNYGSQCVITSIDTRAKKHGVYTAYVNRGTEDVGRNVVDLGQEMVDRGTGEVLVTSIQNDGMGEGLDCGLIKHLSSSLNVPIIASGGCGLAEHFVAGYRAGASAVAAGTFFCRRDQNPMQCRAHIRNDELPIRLEV